MELPPARPFAAGPPSDPTPSAAFALAASAELPALLELVRDRTGVDFRQYAPASLARRIARFALMEGMNSPAECRARLHVDPAAADRFVRAITVGTTSLFRDPSVYLTLRRRVFPHLRTYPRLRIWSAGCSTGEEAYGLAILLREEGLWERCRLHATDLHDAALALARRGEFAPDDAAAVEGDYRAAGGTGQLSDHLERRGDRIHFARELRDRIDFDRHDLVGGGSFQRFELILCRNVLIYFDAGLQTRVERRLHAALAPLGFLLLGRHESPIPGLEPPLFGRFDAAHRIYRRADAAPNSKIP